MLNMDLHRQVVIDTAAQDWEPSPGVGAWRKPLEREAAEHGRASALARYDVGSSFSHHEHSLGEEILVLKGTFSDGHGDYPEGTYLRNPPGSGHAP